MAQKLGTGKVLVEQIVSNLLSQSVRQRKVKRASENLLGSVAAGKNDQVVFLYLACSLEPSGTFCFAASALFFLQQICFLLEGVCVGDVRNTSQIFRGSPVFYQVHSELVVSLKTTLSRWWVFPSDILLSPVFRGMLPNIEAPCTFTVASLPIIFLIFKAMGVHYGTILHSYSPQVEAFK